MFKFVRGPMRATKFTSAMHLKPPASTPPIPKQFEYRKNNPRGHQFTKQRNARGATSRCEPKQLFALSPSAELMSYAIFMLRAVVLMQELIAGFLAKLTKPITTYRAVILTFAPAVFHNAIRDRDVAETQAPKLLHRPVKDRVVAIVIPVMPNH